MLNTLIGRMAGLVLIAVLCGAAANTVSPRQIPWVRSRTGIAERLVSEADLNAVDLERVRQIVHAGDHLLFDARTADEYARGHLPGAFSVPADAADEPLALLAPALERDQPILVYCGDDQCDQAARLARRLRQDGLTRAVVFVEGYAAWRKAGLPVERSQ